MYYKYKGFSFVTSRILITVFIISYSYAIDIICLRLMDVLLDEALLPSCQRTRLNEKAKYVNQVMPLVCVR